MSENTPNPDESPENLPEKKPETQQVQVSNVTARVPSSIGHGVVSTGTIVMNGPHAFILDFLQQIGMPGHLVRRVIIPHAVVPRFIEALEQNLSLFKQKFGDIPKLPKPDPKAKRPTAEELYDNLKIPDDELNGHFADGVMIRHSAAEFCFDFVTHFFPNASVSSRVFLSAPHVTPLLGALKTNYQKLLDAKKNPPSGNPPNPPAPQ